MIIIKILFYRYDSIVEPHMMECFQHAGLEVEYDISMISEKNIPPARLAQGAADRLGRTRFLFVFSINFIPEISDICEIYQVPYVCWTVDSPFLQLFSPSMKNRCNRIFFFDKAQYLRFGQPLGDDHGFYLPLAGNVQKFAATICGTAQEEQNRFQADISMVGSLYKEKDPYQNIQAIPDYLRGYVDGIANAQMQVYGYNMIESLLTETIMKEFEKLVPDIRGEEQTADEKRYKVAHFILGPEIAYRERVTLLNALAEHHRVDLYTLSDTGDLRNVNVRGQAKSYTEMPLIFNRSKINLNITMRPIMTGLSQRVFDVTACGGFLLSNYQEELPELFEIGTEVEAFASKEELLEKADFYLRHDEIRSKIAENGLERVKACHTFEHRFKEMLDMLMKTI